VSELQIEELVDAHFDILKEIGNIGSGNATTALSNLINKKVDMGIPKVQILDFKDVADVVGGEEIPVVGILLNVEGEIKGMMMFILDQISASKLVNILLDREVKDISEFDEMDLSTLKEIGNILTGAYLSSLSTLTNLKIISSVPYLAIDMAAAIISVPAIEFGKIGDKVLFIQSDFGQDIEKVSGYFILIPEMKSFDKILKALGVL